MSPKRDVSGEQVIRHTREKNRNRVAGVLRLAATSLLGSDSYREKRLTQRIEALGFEVQVRVAAEAPDPIT